MIAVTNNYLEKLENRNIKNFVTIRTPSIGTSHNSPNTAL